MKKDGILEELEKLNAFIDVWIDEEDYEKVYDCLHLAEEIEMPGGGARTKLSSMIATLFEHPNCTRDQSAEWCHALSEADWTFLNNRRLPVSSVRTQDSRKLDLQICDDGDLSLIIQYWSRLFYAKLLRAKIQEKGSDCYLDRLDEVVAYLENHLPQPRESDRRRTQVNILYLLELSSASRLHEGLGFADRARRGLRDHRQLVGESFCSFYDLLAAYNAGVAYFHTRDYRSAVREFDRVIKELRQMSGSRGAKHVAYFVNHQAERLLLLPAVLYRAEVQVERQMAYHALDTLQKHFWVCETRSDYVEVRAWLIASAAHQQMGELSRSWKCLGKIYECLSRLQGDHQKLDAESSLGTRLECRVPAGKSLQNVRGRFIDLLVGDHLNWLMRKGEDKEGPSLYLPLLLDDLSVQSPTEQEKHEPEYEQAIENAKSYLSSLKQVFSGSYFTITRHCRERRKGYYQQLANYLAWLAKASRFKFRSCSEVAKIAVALYDERRDGILGETQPDQRCARCDSAGIRLEDLGLGSDWMFTQYMRDFFKAMKSRKEPETVLMAQQREAFINKLIKAERKFGEDLRVHDLELRYESEAAMNLDWDYQSLCWKGASSRKGFAGLLRCAEEDPTQSEHVDRHHYERVLGQWDTLFLRYLEERSHHEQEKDGVYFLGLQRWNSSSPAQGRSAGGGYLLYHTAQGTVDMGIAIDPGFDFVRNLFHMGFSLHDIDVVLISHAHIDHIRDFESMITLLFELQKTGRRDRRLHVILTLGAYRRLEHIIEDPTYRYFLEPYIIDIDKEIEPSFWETLGADSGLSFGFRPVEGNRGLARNRLMDYQAVLPGQEISETKTPKSDSPNPPPRIEIRPTRAYHDDQSRYSDSYGFLIEIEPSEPGSRKVRFGYTGDTKWVYPRIKDPLSEGREIKDISQQYLGCDVLLAHLGSLIKKQGSVWSFDSYEPCTDQKSLIEASSEDLLADYKSLFREQGNACSLNPHETYKLQKKPIGPCEHLVRENNHPYLIGMLRLLSGLVADRDQSRGLPLVLLSEFGEELRGRIRVDLVRRLQQTFADRLAILPVDVGMNVRLPKSAKASDGQCSSEVWCVQCNQLVPIEEADFERYGKDEALFCVCKTCRNGTPLNVLQDRLRQLYDVGHDLKTAQVHSLA